mmetsp:Transcript_20273/g.34968  ORF Transcript_20273/g.34968 Transcript_20273/m.34968 type:complete len:494 (+) Transcript_20273:510-1991(+)
MNSNRTRTASMEQWAEHWDDESWFFDSLTLYHNRDALASVTHETQSQSFILNNQYVVLEELGQGCSSTVYAARDMHTNAKVAIKHIRNALRSMNYATCVLRELQLGVRFHGMQGHQRLLVCKDAFVSEEPRGAAKEVDVFLVFDLCNKSLKDLIQSYASSFSEVEAENEGVFCGGVGVFDQQRLIHSAMSPASSSCSSTFSFISNQDQEGMEQSCISSHRISMWHLKKYMYELLLALYALDKNNIVHSDVKPSNILVDANGDIVLADFGHARYVEQADGGMYPDTARKPARWYQAPEALLDTALSTKLDCWSAGCVMAELMLKSPMFPGDNVDHQLEIICSYVDTPSWITFDPNAHDDQPLMRSSSFHARFAGCDETAVDLVHKLLRFDPKKRFSAEQALRHEFFAELFNRSHLEQAALQIADMESVKLSQRYLEANTEASVGDIRNLLESEMHNFGHSVDSRACNHHQKEQQRQNKARSVSSSSKKTSIVVS